jgi:hypothetical protein
MKGRLKAVALATLCLGAVCANAAPAFDAGVSGAESFEGNRELARRAAVWRATGGVWWPSWDVTPSPTPRKPPENQPYANAISPAPWNLQAPAPDGVAEADRDVVRDLQLRYETAAANAANAWRTAESLRQRLRARGADLNGTSSAALVRLKADMDAAARFLVEKHWRESRLGLERAEYETGRVCRSLGC